MNSKQKTILIVDDEATIREVVRKYLIKEGFQVFEAIDGYEAMDAVAYEPIDLIVLDLMLPGIDGLTITRQLRQHSKKQIPIIILTARNTTNDRIRGLDMGADDYLIKPFSPGELVSRIKAVFRRVDDAYHNNPSQLEFDDLLIDPSSHIVSKQGNIINLSAKEFELLLFFAQSPKQVFSRDQLLEKVWGTGFHGDPSTVTVHIRRLREKIENDPSNPSLLITVWGVGYKFDPNNQ